MVELKKAKGKLANTVSLSCCFTVYSGTLCIAPLVLMPFIENAFRYGVNPEKGFAINIEVLLNGSKLRLQIINNKVSRVYNSLDTATGIENAKQR